MDEWIYTEGQNKNKCTLLLPSISKNLSRWS